MELGIRAFASMDVNDMPRVKIDEHADVHRATLLIARGAEDVVEIGFEDHRHMRDWAAHIIDEIDRVYGEPAPRKRTDIPEPAGSSAFVYGTGEAR